MLGSGKVRQHIVITCREVKKTGCVGVRSGGGATLLKLVEHMLALGSEEIKVACWCHGLVGGED